MLSIIVRIPILNSQCIYFVHSKMIRNAHRLLNSMAVHPGPLPQERGKHAQVPEFSRPLVWNCFMGTHVGCYEVHAEATAAARGAYCAHWIGKLRREHGPKTAEDSPSPQGRGSG